MNKNTIALPSMDIEIPKLTPLQFQLLKLVDKTVREMNGNECSISLSEFGNLKPMDVFNSARENIEVVVVNKTAEADSCRMKSFDIINDIYLEDEKLHFSPSKFFLELINGFPANAKNQYLKNILFHGIRNKQALLLMEFISKDNPGSKEQVLTVTVENMRKIIDLEKETYTPDSLKRLVLDRCVKEITANTNLKVEINKVTEPIKPNAKKMKISSFTISFSLKLKG